MSGPEVTGNMPLPGGGVFGRSAKDEVRNPVLGLPSARAIMDLPEDQRRPVGILLRELAKECDDQAERSWRKRKGFQAAYWRVVCTYAKHLARVIDKRTK